MKSKMVFGLTLASLSMLAIACGNDAERTAPSEQSSSASTENASEASAAPEAAEPAAPQGPVFRTKMMGMEMTSPLVSKTLTAEGVQGMTIQAPEMAQVEIDRGDNTIVAAGVNYSIAIRTGAFNPASTKNIYNIVDPEGTVVVDEPNLVIYRRSGENGSFLFGTGVTVGDNQLQCSTVATAFPFTRDQVDQMVESCRTLSAAN